MMSINIELVVNYLKQLVDESKLEYNWKDLTDKTINRGNERGFLIDSEKDLLINCLEINKQNYYHRNVKLKTMLQDKFSDNYEKNILLCDWIVKEWGGIKNGQNVSEIVNDVCDTLKKDKTSQFNRIASYSKVLSFMDPELYTIYNSRVVYSINWLLFITKASVEYFRPLESRNKSILTKKLKELLQSRLDKYSDSSSYSINKKLFIKEEDCYFEMCKFMKELNFEYHKDDMEKQKYPFYMEMILYEIAPTLITKEICLKIQLND